MPARAPILYLIAGPNCAGKTTFAREFLPAAGVMEFLNADSIAAGLSPLDPPAAAVRAGPIAPGEVEDIDGGRKGLRI